LEEIAIVTMVDTKKEASTTAKQLAVAHATLGRAMEEEGPLKIWQEGPPKICEAHDRAEKETDNGRKQGSTVGTRLGKRESEFNGKKRQEQDWKRSKKTTQARRTSQDLRSPQ
jgi:hypothetical protein